MQTVIVGGGFGGIKAALELSKRQVGKVTLISDETYFLHHATLYATATGRNDAESVVPLRYIFENHPNVEIVTDRITDLDPTKQIVSSRKKSYHYDKLILTLGAVTNYMGIKGMSSHSYGIKSLDDIREFRDHIHDEIAEGKVNDEFFIIGAGHTGVELAGALSEYVKELKGIYNVKTNSRIVLVEAAPRILTKMSGTAANKVHKKLEKLGVRVLVDHSVESLNSASIRIEGRTYSTKTAVWTSGVSNHPFFLKHSKVFTLTKSGHVQVNEFLEAKKNIYVIGDNNSVKYTGLASAALQQGAHAAKNIVRSATGRPQKVFRPRKAAQSIPLGDHWGYVEKWGIYVAGHTGATFRRFIELHGLLQLMPFKKALPLWRARSLRAIDED